MVTMTVCLIFIGNFKVGGVKISPQPAILIGLLNSLLSREKSQKVF